MSSTRALLAAALGATALAASITSAGATPNHIRQHQDVIKIYTSTNADGAHKMESGQALYNGHEFGISEAISPHDAASLRPMSPDETKLLPQTRENSYGTDAGSLLASPEASGSGPPAEINWQECRDNKASSRPVGWIKNHFEFCQVDYWHAVDIDLPTGTVRGKLDFRSTQRGYGSSTSRDVNVHLMLDQVRSSGTYDTGILSVDLVSTGWPTTASCEKTGRDPYLPVEAWKRNGHVAWHLDSPAGTGGPPDGRATCVYKFQYFFTVADAATTDKSSPEWGTRYDSAPYLAHKNGAIYDRVIPWLGYSASDPKVKGVAQHILQAQTHPETTLPKKTSGPKVIPGGHLEGNYLKRLFEGYDEKQYNKNRSTSQSECDALFGTPRPPGQQCDEYPFASTYEGAGKGDGNYSLKLVPSEENSRAGTALRDWYRNDRILHLDPFAVLVRP